MPATEGLNSCNLKALSNKGLLLLLLIMFAPCLLFASVKTLRVSSLTLCQSLNLQFIQSQSTFSFLSDRP